MRGVGDRAGEIERLLAFLGDDRGRDGDIIFAGRDAGEDTGPGQDLLLDLERRVFAQIADQLVVEARWLAVLDELERTEIVLGRDDQSALLDFVETGGLAGAREQGRRGERGQQAERQPS